MAKQRIKTITKIRVEKNSGDSEFLQLTIGLPIQEVLAVVDELMNTTKIMNVRVYESVINQIRRIRAD